MRSRGQGGSMISMRARVIWLTILSVAAGLMISARWIWGGSLLQVLGGVVGALCVLGWFAVFMELQLKRQRNP